VHLLSVREQASPSHSKDKELGNMGKGKSESNAQCLPTIKYFLLVTLLVQTIQILAVTRYQRMELSTFQHSFYARGCHV
jgi:hypothetical protein